MRSRGGNAHRIHGAVARWPGAPAVPLPSGDHVLYNLLADGHEEVAKTEFRVK